MSAITNQLTVLNVNSLFINLVLAIIAYQVELAVELQGKALRICLVLGHNPKILIIHLLIFIAVFVNFYRVFRALAHSAEV